MCVRVWNRAIVYEVVEVKKKKTQWNQQKVQFRARSLIHLHDLHANENEKNATFVCVCVCVDVENYSFRRHKI